MNTKLKGYKNTLREYMREHYTDANLVELLESARSGFLAYNTCCCFIGLPTRDHGGYGSDQVRLGRHTSLFVKHDIPSAVRAENAFLRLWNASPSYDDSDAIRRRILIPMILAELKRRRLETQPVQQLERVHEHT